MNDSIEILTKRSKYGDDELSSNELYLSKKSRSSDTITLKSPFGRAIEFARAGDRASLRKLLITGALSSINLTNDKSETLLMVACSEGRLDCVNMFLDFGANMSHISGSSYIYDEKHSALSVASKHGHIDIVKLLLTNGVEVSSSNNKNVSALIAACEGGHCEIVGCLLDAGADINIVQRKLGTALRIACKHGHTAVVELLLARGATINLTDRHGATPLITACRANKGDVVALLLKNNADMTVVDCDGCNALTTSCEAGATDAAEHLLKAGADANAIVSIDGFKGTLFGYACSKDNADLMRLLVKYGALVDETDSKGDTPLILMCKLGESGAGTVKVLLELHADINKANYRGRTPLMTASSKGFLPSVEALLDAGATIDASDDLGRTALFYSHSVPVLNLLLSRGADINIVSKYRGSALYAASLTYRWDLVERLLELGADLHGNGVALISRARRDSRLNIAELVLDREVTEPLLAADIARLAEDQTTYPDLTKLTATTALIEIKTSVDGSKLTYREICARIKSGEIESFRGVTREAFLEAGYFTDPESFMFTCFNAIMTAYRNNRLDILELLLEFFYYKFNDFDEIKALRPPLLLNACLCGQFDAAKLMLDYCTGVAENDGRTPLNAACHPTNTGYACTEGQRFAPVQTAAASPAIHMVKLVLVHGASVNHECASYTPLVAAALAGDLEVMKLLLHEGAFISTSPMSTTGSTLLAACRSGNVEAVKLLQSHGVELAPHRAECMLVACEYGRPKLAEWLLEQGASVDATNTWDKEKKSPMYGACMNGRVEVAQLLLQRGAKVEPSLLPMLWKDGVLGILKLLVEHGADMHTIDSRGRSPLHIASLHARSDVVKRLLESGADVNKVDNQGKTALDLVNDDYNYSFEKQPVVILALLEHGAGLNTDTSALFTRACQTGCDGILKILLGRRAPGSDTLPLSKALYDCCSFCWPDVFRLLLQHGATVAEADEGHEEWPCLIEVIRYNHTTCPEIVTILLDNGAEVNKAGYGQRTALATACEKGSLKVIKLLIARGADIGAADTRGYSPLIQASMGGKIEVFKLLIANGADLEQADIDGNTPLIMAARSNKVNRIRPLLEAGADVTVTNHNGETALDYFADNTAMLELCGGYLDRNMGSRKPLLK